MNLQRIHIKSATLAALAVTAVLTFLTGPALADYYAVHVSSFKQPANAAKEVAGYRSRGTPAEARLEAVPGKGKWRRVYVGRFSTRQEALALGESLRDQGRVGYYQVRRLAAAAEASVGGRKPIRPLGAQPDGVRPRPSRPKRSVTPPPTPQRPAALNRAIHLYCPPPMRACSRPVEAGPMPLMAAAGPPAAKPAPAGEGGLAVDAPAEAAVVEEVISEEIVTEDPIRSGRITVKTPPSLECRPITGCKPQVREPDQEGPCPGADPRDERGFWFSAGVGVTTYFNVDDFRIFRTTGGVTETWGGDPAPAVHVVGKPSYRFNRDWAVEGGVERTFGRDWSLWQFWLGPKFRYPLSCRLAPWVSAGPVAGSLNWDGAPGEFDTGLGWQAGGGLDFKMGDGWKADLSVMYRSLRLSYTPAPGAWSTAGDLDLSGVLFSGTLGYMF
jgi:hypothetical protein